MGKRLRRPWSPLLAVLATALLPGTAPAAETPREETFAGRITVTVVEIPVRVLKRGKPVQGLTAENFEIYDEGELQELTGFEVLDLSTSPLAEPAAPGPERASSRRNFLLLFDFAFSANHRLGRAVQGARTMVTFHLQPTDRVAVAVYGGAGPRLILGFTGDRDRIRLALDVVEARLNRDRALERELRAALRRRADPDGGNTGAAQYHRLAEEIGPTAALVLGEDGGLFDPGQVTMGFQGGDSGLGLSPERPGFDEPVGNLFARLVAQTPQELADQLAQGPLYSAVRHFSRSLARFITLLRDVPGQKHLVYMSEGLPSPIFRSFDSELRPGILARLEELLEAFRRSGWTLHAMDVEGIPDAFTQGFDGDSLLYMADGTGGSFYENFNNLGAAAERLVEETSVTYVLAFQPRGIRADGRYHQVTVKLKGGPRRARVVHRPGYYAPKPPGERSDLEDRLDTAALVLSSQEAREIAVQLLVTPVPDGRDLVPVPVVLEVDGKSLLAGDDGEVVQVDLHAYALDPQGGVHDLFAHQLQFGREEMEAVLRQGGVRFLGDLALPAGEYTLRVLVRNPGTGRLSLFSTRLPVARRDDRGLALLPPLFLDTGEGWVVAREVRRADLFTLGDRGFVPAIRPILKPGEGMPVCLLLSHHPVDQGLRLSSRVLDRDGREVRGGILQFGERISTEGDGLHRILAVFHPQELPAGEYRLEVSVADGTGLRQVSRSTDFTVVR